MSGQWRFHEMPVGFRITARGSMPKLPGHIDARVEAHWRAANERTSGLFNGRVFTADVIEDGTFQGHFTEFRRVVAQYAEPGLFVHLNLRPMSICGLLMCCDRGGTDGRHETLILGRRDKAALFRPSIWEAVPGGSLDPSGLDPNGSIDWLRQLMTELGEELGVTPSAIVQVLPLGFLEYDEIGAIEVCVRLDCSWTATEIFQSHQISGSKEIQDLKVVDMRMIDLDNFTLSETHIATQIFVERQINPFRHRSFDGFVPDIKLAD